ncbi:MAG: NADH-quinone oxidoreductase subunit C, partial [Chloroflexota bacterium]
MSLDAPYRQFYQWAEKYGEWLYLPAPNHIATRLQEPDALRAFARLLAGARVYLATVVANDERELEDHCFKIYYLFSHPIADLFLTVEYLLGQGAEFYPSLFALFPAVDPFERKIRDLFGLKAIRENGETVQPRSWLHAPYPADLFPLRRDRTNAQLKQAVDAYNRDGLDRSTPVETMSVNPGSLLLSVGPVHAGIIEPGRFVFRIAGEVIDDLTIFLGYAHKGIERLFQTRLTLMDGWRLAEQVSGDSAFAHGLAYCRAVETLANAPPSPAAELLRGLFLELERIYNHIGDVAALAQDVALEQIASEIAVVRENLVRLNAAIAGHRYLRGLNRPGGICLPQPLDCARIAVELPSAVEAFNILAEKSMNLSAFRDRTIEAGVLTASDALATGATGLAARA